MNVFFSGFLNGIKMMISLSKILVPAILIVKILEYTYAYTYVSKLFVPWCNVVGLPGTVAIPFFMGIVSNIYGGLGGMIALNLDYKEMTILGTMIAICHGGIIENSIAVKADSSMGLIFFVRLIAAIFSGMMLKLIL
jgi:hypothetical protein